MVFARLQTMLDNADSRRSKWEELIDESDCPEGSEAKREHLRLALEQARATQPNAEPDQETLRVRCGEGEFSASDPTFRL
jgi:hypothetical protein